MPDTVLFISIYCFVQPSLCLHFCAEKIGGSERLYDWSKFRNPDSIRAGFWTSICLIPKLPKLMYFLYTMPPSGERHLRKISWPTVLLRTCEDDVTWISGPYVKKTQLRQRDYSRPPAIPHPAFSSSRTSGRRQQSSFRKQHHDPGEDGSKGNTKATPPWAYPQEWKQRAQSWGDIHLRKKVIDYRP